MCIWLAVLPCWMTTQLLVAEPHQPKLWNTWRSFSYWLSLAGVELQIERGSCECCSPGFCLAVVVSIMNISQSILLVWPEVSLSLHTDNILAEIVGPQAALVLLLPVPLVLSIQSTHAVGSQVSTPVQTPVRALCCCCSFHTKCNKGNRTSTKTRHLCAVMAAFLLEVARLLFSLTLVEPHWVSSIRKNFLKWVKIKFNNILKTVGVKKMS